MLLALILSTFSFAAVTETTCDLPELNATLTFSMDRNENVPDVVKSVLEIDGEKIPAVAEKCFFRNVPGQRGFFCAHRQGETRYDVYPRFTLLNDPAFDGKVKRAGVILPSAENPTSYSTVDCN